MKSKSKVRAKEFVIRPLFKSPLDLQRRFLCLKSHYNVYWASLKWFTLLQRLLAISVAIRITNPNRNQITRCGALRLQPCDSIAIVTPRGSASVKVCSEYKSLFWEHLFPSTSVFHLDHKCDSAWPAVYGTQRERHKGCSNKSLSLRGSPVSRGFKGAERAERKTGWLCQTGVKSGAKFCTKTF